MRCRRPSILYVYFCEAKKAELVILVLSYKTSPLFLIVVLRNLVKTRLAYLHYTYDVKVLALVT